MALLIYFDAACTDMMSSDGTNPDSLRQSTTSGQTITHERSLWIKSDDVTKTYEDIVLTAQGDDTSADVMYAPDNAGSAGTYIQSLDLVDGTFGTAVRVWRKITAPSITEAFNRSIQHKLNYTEWAI